MNRLNRERRSNGATWRSELAKIEKDIRGIIEAIKAGMFHPSMKGEMDKLEARKAELTDLLQNVPQDQPDILPAAAQTYARRVAELTDALNHPETQAESADQLRVLIEKIVLTPGPNRGEVYARLHGDLATILEWVSRQEGKTGAKSKTPGGIRSGVLVSVVAGASYDLYLRPEQAKMVAGIRIHQYSQSTPTSHPTKSKRTPHSCHSLFRVAA